MHGEHWNISRLGSFCFDKIINQSSPSFLDELTFSGTLIFLSWSIFDIYTPFLKLACKMEHSKLAENLTVTRNVIITYVLDRTWLVLCPKTRFAVPVGASCYLSQTVFSICCLITLKSNIWDLLPECIAYNWSFWFLDFSSLPQPFWILILSLNVPHFSQAQVALFI